MKKTTKCDDVDLENLVILFRLLRITAQMTYGSLLQESRTARQNVADYLAAHPAAAKAVRKAVREKR